ncbi:hypothetical protein STCU_11434 [Strigomonas culicis]|uniref:Integral membrane protein n=1 Tax=Strigomonas culicis TaxID=28005 RepID=S9TIR9_9TRYP|nr:hypothetical protein STCU_11434 [Strigomonas culicis]|eukprot:EPY16268.1 hypothetical protein STCU_11434 [Strigomonas culicis]
MVLAAVAALLCACEFRIGYVRVREGNRTVYVRPFFSDEDYVVIDAEYYGLNGLVPTALVVECLPVVFAVVFCAIRVLSERQRAADDAEREGLDVFSTNTLTYYVQKEAYRRRVDRAIGIVLFSFLLLSVAFQFLLLGVILFLHHDFRMNCEDLVVVPCTSTLSVGFGLTVACLVLALVCLVLLVVPCACGFSFKKPSYERLLERAHTDCPVELVPRRNLKLAVSAADPLKGSYGGRAELDVIVGRIGASAMGRGDGGGYVGMGPVAYVGAPAHSQRVARAAGDARNDAGLGQPSDPAGGGPPALRETPFYVRSGPTETGHSGQAELPPAAAASAARSPAEREREAATAETCSSASDIFGEAHAEERDTPEGEREPAQSTEVL